MDYKELDIWIETRKLVNMVYGTTKNYPECELFGLVNQIRRSSVSVFANVAEACGRNSYADTIRILYIARGSLYELETQLYISFDQHFITTEVLNQTQIQISKCKRLLNGFINYLKSQK